MSTRMITKAAILLVLAFCIYCCGGCVIPSVTLHNLNERPALHQEGIAKASKDALKKPKLEALLGYKVWVDVACISSSAGMGEGDEHFLKNMIIETLVESGVMVVEKGEAEVALRAITEIIGVDSVVRIFPHQWLPLMYYIANKAHVNVHIYAYDLKDAQPVAVSDCTGTYSWSEWSALGLGPFR